MKGKEGEGGRKSVFSEYGFADGNVLDRERGTTKEIIRKKHRQLMLLNHPDRGGSPYLATKVNE